MFKLGELPIGRQILIVTLALCAAVFSILITVVSINVSTSATAVAEQNLKDELKIVADLMEYAFVQGVNRAKRNADQFVKTLSGKITVDDKTVKTGPAELPSVRVGDRIINADADLLAKFRDVTGVEVAILMRHKGELFRITTLLKDKDGKPMHGIAIPKGDPTEVAYGKGTESSAMVERNGKTYSLHLLPIKDAKGEMVAAVSARVDLTDDMLQFRKILSNVKIGKTGYLYAFRPTNNEDAAVFSVHPKLEGKSLRETFANDPAAFAQFKEAIKTKGGQFHYLWPDAGEGGKLKDKFAVFLDVPSWGWILGGGTFTEEFHNAAYTLRTELIVESGIAAVLLVGLLYLLVMARFSRITPLLDAMDKQGKGDLTACVPGVPATSRNEIDVLARRFNQSGADIRTLVANLAGTVGRIGSSSDALERSAGEIAKSTGAQSEAANSMAASIEELTVSISQVADNAHEASESNQAAKLASSEGRTVIQDSIAEMQRIADGINGSAQQINQLGERSRQISGIVKVIGEIASQTNLLALNAAIEAARAGEHGRGFAVVADEIRKLSERTGKSAQEITQMIASVQGETEVAVERMSAVAQEMSAGVEQVKVVGATLEQIDARTGETTELATQIAAAVKEQQVASEQVARRLEAIAEAAEENAALTGNNREVAQGLRQCAGDLEAQIRHFRIDA
jgi:methyl-accepting chemotaxis protein